MNPMLNIAIRAARAAGDIIIRQIDHVQDLPVIKKSRNDFVTEVDKHAEMVIIETLHKSYPNHAILAEESGRQGDSPYLWIIDPLDGTTNYLHGFPQYAVSIALQHRGELDQAVVYDPLRQELFTASRGGGAMLNNRRIRVSKQKHLEGALLGTGFPFKEQERLDEYLDSFKALFPMTAGIRRAGAASLDLAYVACGRLDGFWELGLKPWDIAAGALLVKEAGGMISDFCGDENYMETGNIVAATPEIFNMMKKKINSK
ncbi:MAG: inositol monophosphatase [Proteobacteria bacterium]|nr:inositol monophosphatase [Pseudomonadota bacterium]